MNQLHLMKQVFAEPKVESLQINNSTLFPSAILFFQKGNNISEKKVKIKMVISK